MTRTRLVRGGRSLPGCRWCQSVADVALALLPLLAVALALGTRPLVGAFGCVAVIAVAEISQGYPNPFVVVLVVGPWLVRWLLRSRRQLLTQLRARSEELTAESDRFAAESVRYERARIARELHDIVAHCMSVVVVQAAAARRVRDPALTAEALTAIAVSTSEAREEMDWLIGLLDNSTDPARTGGLAVVTDLVDRARATGLPVSANVTNIGSTITRPVAETVHRVIQEAITNAFKHAPGAPIHITIDSHDHRLHAIVVNEPASGGVNVLHTIGGSHGLAGMPDELAPSPS